MAAARAAQSGGASWLAVATAAEAVALRAAGVRGPLLVMGALSPGELDRRAARRRRRRRLARGLRRRGRAHPDGVGARRAREARLGDGRLGTRDAEEATAVAEAVAAAPALALVGAMTHFATADDDPAFARDQLAAFLPWAERAQGARCRG